MTDSPTAKANSFRIERCFTQPLVPPTIDLAIRTTDQQAQELATILEQGLKSIEQREKAPMHSGIFLADLIIGALRSPHIEHYVHSLPNHHFLDYVRTEADTHAEPEDRHDRTESANLYADQEAPARDRTNTETQPQRYDAIGVTVPNPVRATENTFIRTPERGQPAKIDRDRVPTRLHRQGAASGDHPGGQPHDSRAPD